MYKVAPLPSTFMLISILGFLITCFYIAPKDMSWGITFIIVFAAMNIAAFVSATRAPIIDKEAMGEEPTPKKAAKK